MGQLLASASGAQVAIARTVGIAEVPTAMLSSPIVDFVVDPHLLHLFPSHRMEGESRWRSLWRHTTAPEHLARNRRGIYITSIVTGSFVGAIVHRVAGEQIVLLVGVVVKVLITVGFAVAPCEKRKATTTTERLGEGHAHDEGKESSNAQDGSMTAAAAAAEKVDVP